ncbi:PAS domain-containing protein [Parapedobacter sp. GCM10030251]|uniref:PAS domain-containing protein n=1 Tax=Parapedobacter sp. GCM10030251 TaxID=3273419 RepID=UPI00360BC033
MEDKVDYLTVFRTISIPSIVLLPNAPLFTIVDANDAYLELVLKSRAELVGKGFFDVFPSNPYLSENAWKKNFDTILREKKRHQVPPQKYAFPLTTSPTRFDIKYLKIEQTPILDDRGEIRLIIRSMTDVTESINHDQFLQDTQQVARIGSWEVNIARQTVIWSQGLREIYEVSPDYQPSLESALAFYTDEDDRQQLIAAFEKAVHEGTVFRVALPITTQKGNKRWILSAGKADFINGVCVRVYGVSKDITEKKYQQEALIASEHKFQDLIETIDGIVWEADARTYKTTFISGKVEQILGYTAEEWLADDRFWLNHIVEADRERAVEHYYATDQTQIPAKHAFDYRMVKKDGGIVSIKDIVSVIYEADAPRWLRGIMVDITETKRLADLDQLEKTMLELNEQRQIPLAHILSDYLTGIESLFPGMYCSLYRIQNNRLRTWIAPSLPAAYLQTIDNIAIGENSGSCGAAAHLKRPVVINDITADSRCTNYKHLALAYNLKACWSHPILDSEGNAMAVLSMYYKRVQSPKAEELAIVDRTGSLLKVIIENRQSADSAHEASVMMSQGQQLARFGIWQRDIETHKVSWSDTLYEIYGFDAKNQAATFENYLQSVHPDDRQQVMDVVHRIQDTGEDTVFEERIIRPNGETRHLRSWVRLIGGSHAPRKLIGASLDVTDTKLAEQKMNALYTQLEQYVTKIEASEKKYSDLFHLSPQPMWVYSLDTYQFLDVNRAAVTHYGFSREEFLAMTIKEIRPEEELPKLEAAVAFVREHETLFTKGVYRHRKKDGTLIDVEIQSNIIQFQGQKAEVVLVNDITEKVNYVKAIEAQNSKLQEIAWMQSHVVRAPVARIMGLVDVIQRFPKSAVDHDELLDAINRAATELDDIIHTITEKAEQIHITST